MKKVNVLLITAALVLISISTIIATEVPASIYVTKAGESNKIILNLENMAADRVICEFRSEDGDLFFRDEVITAENVSKQYDLSQLPNGRYTIEVNDLMKIERLNLSIYNGSVQLNERVADITFKPTVWLNEDKSVDFNLMTLGSSASLSIYDTRGNELKSDRFKKVNVASKRYDLSKVEAGIYRVVISHKGETFTHTLTL